MDNLDIRVADDSDLPYLLEKDPHITPDMLRRKVAAGEVLIASASGQRVGYLRWGWFWDNVPFMNLLRLDAEWRRKGIGTRLVARWEADMRALGADFVLTSTWASEEAQHFYRALGYQDIGGFVFPREPLELMLYKRLDAQRSAAEFARD